MVQGKHSRTSWYWGALFSCFLSLLSFLYHSFTNAIYFISCMLVFGYKPTLRGHPVWENLACLMGKCPVVFDQDPLKVSVRLNLKSPLNYHLLKPMPYCSLGHRLSPLDILWEFARRHASWRQRAWSNALKIWSAGSLDVSVTQQLPPIIYPELFALTQ